MKRVSSMAARLMAVVGLAGIASAQLTVDLSGAPTCILPCISSIFDFATLFGCPTTSNRGCLCSQGNAIGAYGSCIRAVCTPDDVLTSGMIALGNTICLNAQETGFSTLTSSQTTPSTNPATSTDSGSVTSDTTAAPSSSASTPASTSAPGSSSSSSSSAGAAAATNSDGGAVEDQTGESTSRPNLRVILPSVLCTAAGVALLAFLLAWFLRRGKQQKAAAANEAAGGTPLEKLGANGKHSGSDGFRSLSYNEATELPNKEWKTPSIVPASSIGGAVAAAGAGVSSMSAYRGSNGGYAESRGDSRAPLADSRGGAGYTDSRGGYEDSRIGYASGGGPYGYADSRDGYDDSYGRGGEGGGGGYPDSRRGYDSRAAYTNSRAEYADSRAEYAESRGDYADSRAEYASTHGGFSEAEALEREDRNNERGFDYLGVPLENINDGNESEKSWTHRSSSRQQ